MKASEEGLPASCCRPLQPEATEQLEKVDKAFETFYSYIVRDALDVSMALSAHGRCEDIPNVPSLSQVRDSTFDIRYSILDSRYCKLLMGLWAS